MTSLAEVKAELESCIADPAERSGCLLSKQEVRLLLAALPPADEEHALSAFETVLMPKEPTKAMLQAAIWALDKARERDGKLQDPRPYTAAEKHAIRYRAMVEARPAQPAGEPVASISIDQMFQNVDHWGALEWFERLVDAIKNQDRCVVAGDDLNSQTYRYIVASSAMVLAREHAAEIRAALAHPSPQPADTRKVIEAIASTFAQWRGVPVPEFDDMDFAKQALETVGMYGAYTPVTVGTGTAQPADMEKAVEAAIDAAMLTRNSGNREWMRAALTAAAPFLRGAAKADVLVTTLEWYADPTNWVEPRNALRDEGNRAKAALRLASSSDGGDRG